MQPYLSAYAIIDATSTSIPGSGSPPLQVNAALPKTVSSVIVRDGIQGKFMGIYRGAVGFETLVAIVGGPGESMVPMWVFAGQRVSIRNMDVAAIVTGTMALSFISEA